jgi:dihydroxyacetone kinase-like protein
VIFVFDFFDCYGKPIKSTLNSRVIGIDLETLKQVERVVAIAGGVEKVPAILAA